MYLNPLIRRERLELETGYVTWWRPETQDLSYLREIVVTPGIELHGHSLRYYTLAAYTMTPEGVHRVFATRCDYPDGLSADGFRPCEYSSVPVDPTKIAIGVPGVPPNLQIACSPATVAREKAISERELAFWKSLEPPEPVKQKSYWQSLMS